MSDGSLTPVGLRIRVARRAADVDAVVTTLLGAPSRLARLLTPEALEGWLPTITQNLDRLGTGVRGEPHLSNLERWRRLVGDRDIPGIRRVLTGLDTSAIEMREVSPLGGLLSEAERLRLLRDVNCPNVQG